METLAVIVIVALGCLWVVRRLLRHVQGRGERACADCRAAREPPMVKIRARRGGKPLVL